MRDPSKDTPLLFERCTSLLLLFFGSLVVRLVVAYSRKEFKQTGDGHYRCAFALFLSVMDLVFSLVTNRKFKYLLFLPCLLLGRLARQSKANVVYLSDLSDNVVGVLIRYNCSLLARASMLCMLMRRSLVTLSAGSILQS